MVFCCLLSWGFTVVVLDVGLVEGRFDLTSLFSSSLNVLVTWTISFDALWFHVWCGFSFIDFVSSRVCRCCVVVDTELVLRLLSVVWASVSCSSLLMLCGVLSLLEYVPVVLLMILSWCCASSQWFELLLVALLCWCFVKFCLFSSMSLFFSSSDTEVVLCGLLVVVVVSDFKVALLAICLWRLEVMLSVDIMKWVYWLMPRVLSTPQSVVWMT